MSNLIKSDQPLLFEIHSFEGEEVRQGRLRCGPGFTNPGAEGASDAAGREEEDSQERRARLEREAYEKGFDQGQRDGMALGQKRVEEKIRQVEALLDTLGQLKNRLYHEAEGDLLKLSLEIARKVLRSEVRTDPAIVTRAIRAAIEHLADRSRIRILIHPQDMAEVRRTLPEAAEAYKLERWELIEDRSIQRGGCILESGFGRVNVTLEEQLETLWEELGWEHGARMEADREPVP